MTKQKSKESVFMSKYLSWPVVCVLSLVLVVIAHFQIPPEASSHEGYLFTLAGYLAMSSTFIAGAFLEQSNPNFFGGRMIVFYRFWLACCSLGTILFWLILRLLPIPVWDVQPRILIACYGLMFFGSLFIAWLISRRGHATASVDENQPK